MNKEKIIERIEQIKSDIIPIREALKSFIDELNILYNNLGIDNGEIPFEVMQIINIVTNCYGMNYKKILEVTREERIKECRQVCQYFIKEFFGYKYNYKQIAVFTGVTSHSTVYNSVKRIEFYCDTEKKFKFMIADLRVKINSDINKNEKS